MMKAITLAVALTLAPLSAVANTNGDYIIGSSSDEDIVTIGHVGATTGFHGSSGGPAVGLINIHDGKLIAVSSVMGFATEASRGISRFGEEVLVGEYDIDSHNGMGQWSIAQVANLPIYYGVWDGKVAGTEDPQTVAFFVGDGFTTKTDVKALANKKIEYTVVGVQSGVETTTANTLGATLTANINAAGTGGTVAGTFKDNYGAGKYIDGFTAAIDAEGGIDGTSNRDGDVIGQLYGAKAEAIAGYVAYDGPKDSNVLSPLDNFAFGGTGVIK